jgi:hypothetical protein
MDITLKNIPDGCEGDVREAAMSAVERFMHFKDLKVEKAKIDKFESDVDAIRLSNNTLAKFDFSKNGEVQ